MQLGATRPTESSAAVAAVQHPLLLTTTRAGGDDDDDGDGIAGADLLCDAVVEPKTLRVGDCEIDCETDCDGETGTRD